jgi:hypothetical protein
LLFASFGFSYQPAWAFVNEDGQVRTYFGALGEDGLEEESGRSSAPEAWDRAMAGTFGPDALPVVWLVEVVVNEDAETLRVFRVTDAYPDIDREQTLRAVLKTASFPLPLGTGASPAQFRSWAGQRPHVRSKVIHRVRSNGEADGELKELGGGPRDLEAGEYEIFVDRVLALTAARVLEELQQPD